MAAIPTCTCGSRRWFALRDERVVSEADLDANGVFGEEEPVDGDLNDLVFICRDCKEEAPDTAEEQLSELYYGDA